MAWQTVDADIITELVQERKLCLFGMEDDALFNALTDPKNSAETWATLSRGDGRISQECHTMIRMRPAEPITAI